MRCSRCFRRLGAPESELEVLRGDEQLLQILAEDPAARAELERVMAWHRERLRRVVEELPEPPLKD